MRIFTHKDLTQNLRAELSSFSKIPIRGFSTPLGTPKAVHLLFCCCFFFHPLRNQFATTKGGSSNSTVPGDQRMLNSKLLQAKQSSTACFGGVRVWSPRKMMWKHAKQRKTAMSSEEARPLLHEFWKTRCTKSPAQSGLLMNLAMAQMVYTGEKSSSSN